MSGNFRLACWIALLLPLALLAGAWGSQLIGGLYPCEMCHWQRWPHYAAVGLAALGFLSTRRGVAISVSVSGRSGTRTSLVALAAVAIAVSGAIGLFHAGVEYGWWQGVTTCSSTVAPGGGDPLERIMAAPMIRCDVPQWTLAGVSLAGFNAIFSLVGAITIFLLMRRR